MITADKQLVEKLNQLIDDNLDNPSFNVDAICQALGISRSRLHRTTKEQAELSASLYIRKRRLLKAKHLLLTTSLRISEIGDQVGIVNPQNFSTYFIEEFEASPSEYRKLHAQPSPAVVEPLPSPEAISTRQILSDVDKPTENLQTRPKFSRRRGLLYVGVALGLLLIFGSLYWWYQSRPADWTNQPTDNSLAVLPFTNLGDADSNPACESIMDDIRTSVSRIRSLKVISRSSSDQYKETQKSIWRIGDELHVAKVLKGSVLKTADQIQIKVEIINAKDDILVWAKKYDAPYKAIFQLTDQIVQDVIDQLKLPLNTPVSEKLIVARTQNLDAYNALLQGRQLMISRKDADLLVSIARFDRALSLDSTFAEAHAAKAVAYHLLRGSDKIDSQKLDRLTEKSALNAIRLDPTNSTAYGVLGSLYYSTYQWQASENAFRIALQHNPNDAQANHWYSLLLRTMGRLDEAIHYSSQAIALNPLHPIMMSVHISNCSAAHRFDLAREGIETGRGLFDNSFAYQIAKADYWIEQADYGRAVSAFQQALVLNPDDRGQIPILLYCEAKRGNRQKAITFLTNLKATTPRADYERAVVYAGLSQADSSLYYLKKAADGGYLYRDTKAMPVFSSYHSNPVFKSILRQFKLPEK